MYEHWFKIEITDGKGHLLLQLKTPYQDFAVEVIQKFGKECLK
jgi:hypothetical protein